jgi:hypothetical protein
MPHLSVANQLVKQPEVLSLMSYSTGDDGWMNSQFIGQALSSLR